MAVQGGVGGVQSAHGHALGPFLRQQFAHQGPGGALAPVLGQHGHGADAAAGELFAAQPLAEGDRVGDGHDLVVGVGAQPAPGVEGDPVRSGLHVEGQRPDGRYGRPVIFGGWANL